MLVRFKVMLEGVLTPIGLFAWWKRWRANREPSDFQRVQVADCPGPAPGHFERTLTGVFVLSFTF